VTKVPQPVVSRHWLASVLLNNSREILPGQVQEALQSLRHSRLERRQRDLRRHLLDAEARGDSATVRELMAEKMELDRALRQA